jgi:hypothetical protein
MTVEHARGSNGHADADLSQAAVRAHAGVAAPARRLAGRAIVPVLLIVAGLVILRRLNRGEVV